MPKFNTGQEVSFTNSGETNLGQVWGFKDLTGQYVVFVPALNRCVVTNEDSLRVR